MSPKSKVRAGSGKSPSRTGADAANHRCFPKDARLRARAEFKRASASGARRTSPHFIVYLAQNRLGRRRLGITASRKVGNAVVRNRVKRLVREYFRNAGDKLPDSRDYVVIARRGAGPMGLHQVARELGRAIAGPRG